jgi:hypothetical protein
MSSRPKKAVALSAIEGDAKYREGKKPIKKQISQLALAGPFRHRQA